MTENPQPEPRSSSPEMDVIRIGFLQIPRDQLFPVLLVFVLLVTGLAVVVATREMIQLLGLVAIIVGLGWGVLIYQNAQNRLKFGAQEATKKFNTTILVLSLQGQPVRGAAVTVLGPVPFTDRKTDKDGRVVYTYTGRDANNYRNRDVTITARHEETSASVSERLLVQDGHYIELRLTSTDGGGPRSPAPAVTTQLPSNTAPGETTTMAMNTDLFQRIVDFVVPHVPHESSRSALINRAFFGDSIVGQISTSGAATEFASHIITQLYTKGGADMVIRLLSELRRDLGSSKQQDIDALIRELQAP
jgi:hypothetical protein